MFNEALALSQELAATRPVYYWHIGLCEPGCDRQAVEALLNRKYRVYRPTMPVSSRNKRGKLITTSKSLFPGYIFVLPSREHDWDALRESPGMRKPFLLRINDRFATIRDTDPAFRIIEDVEKELWRTPEKVAKFRVGQRVSVTKGPFVELQGEIASLDDRGVKVIIDLFRGKIRVTCSQEHLNPA